MSRLSLVVEKLAALQPAFTTDGVSSPFRAPDGTLIERPDHSLKTPGYFPGLYTFAGLPTNYRVEESDGAATPTWTPLTSTTSTGTTFGPLRIAKSDGATTPTWSEAPFVADYKITTGTDHQTLDFIGLHDFESIPGGAGTAFDKDSAITPIAFRLCQKIATFYGYDNFDVMPAVTSADEVLAVIKMSAPWAFDPSKRSVDGVSLDAAQLSYMLDAIVSAATYAPPVPTPMYQVTITDSTAGSYTFTVTQGGSPVASGDTFPLTTTEFKVNITTASKEANIDVTGGTISPTPQAGETATEFTITYTGADPATPLTINVKPSWNL